MIINQIKLVSSGLTKIIEPVTDKLETVILTDFRNGKK